VSPNSAAEDRTTEDGRETQIRAFLRANGYDGFRRERLAGDASTRIYERLHRPDGSGLILMNQPPAAETQVAPEGATVEERRALGYNASARLAGGRMDAFVAVAGYLRDQGLSAPTVHAYDADAGLAVVEDLGDDLFVHRIAGGADEAELYANAVDALIQLHLRRPPSVLEADGVRWPLHRYDVLAFEAGLDPFLEWWPKFASLPEPNADAAAEWSALWAPVKALGEAGADAFAHRDYHAENLLWLPEREGVARVGMVDFQDAVLAHPAWDLLHLLQDARRDVTPTIEAAMLSRYLDARPELDRETFLHGYHALAAANAARILGRVFARQEALFARGKYIAFMPRTWRALERDLDRAGLNELQAWFDRWVPRETRP
jgi:aminoglycoside/choline kinase family phosphotransferase